MAPDGARAGAPRTREPRRVGRGVRAAEGGPGRHRLPVRRIHAYRGEIDLAFEWLGRAEATNDSGLTDAITNPLMRSLHADPRWAAFLDRLRLD